MHDWGAVGLALAQRRPELVERLVVIHGVPFVPGYRWHRIARGWRTPLVGEMAMGFTFRWNIRRDAAGRGRRRRLDHFDHGTQRAILKLYRSAPARGWRAPGSGSGELTAPALVAWARRDPYIAAEFGRRLRRGARRRDRVELDDAGHWPGWTARSWSTRVARFAS